MLIARLDDTIFIHGEYRSGQKLLRSLGIPFRLSHKKLGMTYPEDIALNCFCVGNFLFAGKRGSSPDVLAWAKENGKTLLSVKQGYTKCAAVVAGGAIASSDRGIIAAAESVGIPALLLPPHPIDIEVYDTGFLGGACGLIDKDTLGFFGCADRYPSYDILSDFFQARGVRIRSLSKFPLFDLGGMITVEI